MREAEREGSISSGMFRGRRQEQAAVLFRRVGWERGIAAPEGWEAEHGRKKEAPEGLINCGTTKHLQRTKGDFVSCKCFVVPQLFCSKLTYNKISMTKKLKWKCAQEIEG